MKKLKEIPLSRSLVEKHGLIIIYMLDDDKNLLIDSGVVKFSCSGMKSLFFWRYYNANIL